MRIQAGWIGALRGGVDGFDMGRSVKRTRWPNHHEEFN